MRRQPERAREVKTGALNTVQAGSFIFIESTAAGRSNDFFDRTMQARQLQTSGHPLTKMDYKLFFYPWFWANEYVLNDNVHIPPDYQGYFKGLEGDHGIILSQPQRNWYVKKAEDQGDAMHEEFPSTLDEAFEKRLTGAIFIKEIQRARADKRITALPHERGVAVNVFWDLGHNDFNSMWFHQRVGQYDHFIKFYENRLVDLTHYIEYLNMCERKFDYQWGTMYLPHDGRSRHIEAIAGSAADILKDNGFKVRVVPRTRDKMRSIEATRKQFAHCRFDDKGCRGVSGSGKDARRFDGLRSLEEYRWKWDERGQEYTKSPASGEQNHGADAFQTYGDGYKGEGSGIKRQMARVMSGAAASLGMRPTSKRVSVSSFTSDHII